MRSKMSDATCRLFPLTGMLMLPGTFLPLNVFEERYRKMVERALEDDRRIGMIQPTVPGKDNSGPTVGDPERPQLYDVGCVGELVECEPQSDGRYWIVLKGLSRFRVVAELPVAEGGYRRVRAEFAGFEADLAEMEADFPVRQMLTAAGSFSRALGLDFDIDLLGSLPPAHAVNALSAALPFEPVEKQALLEAHSPTERCDLLLQLMVLPPQRPDAEATDRYEPPTVH